jgi:exosortase family protein XrtF
MITGFIFLQFNSLYLNPMALNAYLSKWHQIPPAVKQFLLKGLLILVVWKVIYLGFLLPGRVLDSPLTNAVGLLTTSGLNWVTGSHNYSSKSELGKEEDVDLNAISVTQVSIYFHHQKIVGIYDGCNTLELLVLYAGFIICMPALVKRKLTFIIGGLTLIFAVNILRCVGIALIIQNYPKQADFAHHYVFVFIVYGLIIALWLAFANKITVKSNVN